jgi:glycine hydroxymethyltransferase
MTTTSHDDELTTALADAEVIDRGMLQLIASENYVSRAVRQATGSVLTNRFVDGLPSARHYGAQAPPVDVESVARRRACALFGAEHANVAVHSGTSANLAVCLATLSPGDPLLGLSTDQGGHLSHGAARNLSGMVYRCMGYGVGSDDHLDFDQIVAVARRERPKIVFCGATAYPRVIDPAPFRELCDEIGALLVFDAAHVAGLIAGGAHPNPVGIADFVTLTTHKTLRGPRGGVVLCAADWAERIDAAVSPGVQGGPLLHVIAAKAIAFREAMQREYREYVATVVDNARRLGAALQDEGFRLVTGGTDTHMVLADLRPFDPGLSGRAAEQILDRVGIAVTRCPAGADERLPADTSAIRLGTAAVTTRGIRPGDLPAVAALVARALRHRQDERELEGVRSRVRELAGSLATITGQ